MIVFFLLYRETKSKIEFGNCSEYDFDKMEVLIKNCG